MNRPNLAMIVAVLGLGPTMAAHDAAMQGGLPNLRKQGALDAFRDAQRQQWNTALIPAGNQRQRRKRARQVRSGLNTRRLA